MLDADHVGTLDNILKVKKVNMLQSMKQILSNFPTKKMRIFNVYTKNGQSLSTISLNYVPFELQIKQSRYP